MNKIKNLLISLLAVMLAACSQSQIEGSINATGNFIEAATVTKQQMIEESRLSAQEMDKNNPIAPPDHPYAKRLKKLTRGLQHYDGLDLDYRVYLVRDINAFAMPDGTVRIFAGLMKIMNDDEVVAVIGHEIGHVANEHALNQYKKVYLAKAAKEGLTAADGSIGRVAGAYGDIAEEFLKAQFSQSDELESDAYGVKVLHDVGRDPYAAVSAQEKLQKLGGGSSSVFSSHPPSEKRIKLAREAADKITGK